MKSAVEKTFGEAAAKLVPGGLRFSLLRWFSILSLLAILVIVLPVASAAGLIANEAQDIAGGVIRSSLVDRLRELRIGPYDVGAQIEALVLPTGDQHHRAHSLRESAQ